MLAGVVFCWLTGRCSLLGEKVHAIFRIMDVLSGRMSFYSVSLEANSFAQQGLQRNREPVICTLCMEVLRYAEVFLSGFHCTTKQDHYVI